MESLAASFWMMKSVLPAVEEAESMWTQILMVEKLTPEEVGFFSLIPSNPVSF